MVLVDSSYLKYYTAFRNDYKDLIIEDPVYFVHAFLRKLEEIKKHFGVSSKNKLVLCNDLKMEIKGNRNYWRDMIRLNYDKFLYRKKDGDIWRPKYYKEGRKKDDNIPWDKLEALYRQLLDNLRDYSDFSVVEVGGVEADDIIAILTQKSKNKHTVITSDKDMVEQINANIYTLLDFDNKKEKSHEPHKLTAFFAMGDSSDGIYGISPRYQWKKNLEKYDGDIYKIMTIIDQDRIKLCEKHDIKNYEDIFKLEDEKLINKLQAKFNLRERWVYNKKVMDLSIENLPPTIVKSVLRDYSKQKQSFNQMKIYEYLSELGIDRCTDGVKSFVEKLDFFRYQENPIRKKKISQKLDNRLMKEFKDDF